MLAPLNIAHQQPDQKQGRQQEWDILSKNQ